MRQLQQRPAVDGQSPEELDAVGIVGQIGFRRGSWFWKIQRWLITATIASSVIALAIDLVKSLLTA